MKFKVGDKVRLTRETIAKNLKIYFKECEICGAPITKIDAGFITIGDGFNSRSEDKIELVPEEPEFEYGEEVEVKFGEDGIWNKAIFLCKIPGDICFPYACVDNIFKEDFLKGLKVEAVCWGYARKLKPQLSRKEIAEKFGVAEDFILID